MNASTRFLKSRRKNKQEEMIIKMNSKHALIQVSKCKHMLVDKKHADKQSHSQINKQLRRETWIHRDTNTKSDTQSQ